MKNIIFMSILQTTLLSFLKFSEKYLHFSYINAGLGFSLNKENKVLKTIKQLKPKNSTG